MFDWMSFHGLAIELAAREDGASQRSAVSRAYYSAFHAALIHAESRGAALPRVEKHAALWEWFDPPQPIPGHTKLETRIGKNGRRLRNRRNAADYEASTDIHMQLEESMRLSVSLLVDLADLEARRR